MSHSEETKAPLETPSEDWAMLPWRKLEQHVYRLQKRIYRAACRGNTQAVHRLQQLLTRSRAARLLAVRRVTQDNQGKKTAGVDGIASLPPQARLPLAESIHPKHQEKRKPKPVRSVWIPKPGKTELRPPGMPTMYDRACQALAKQALEPEWEARFENHSYGFRPGRGQHDAIEAIFTVIVKKSKWVLDADVRGCFDHSNHQALLSKLMTYPAMRRAIKAWLNAGVMDGTESTPTTEGTPQGGPLSPLLANVALHGLETRLAQAFTYTEGRPILIRYADDFVAFHPEKTGAEKAKQVVETWLQDIGLELKPSKTRIVHTLEGEAGFNFLGMNVRPYPAGKTHSGKDGQGGRLGFKTLVKPSEEAIKRHMEELAQIIRENQAASQEKLIAELNRVIKGWTYYHRTVVASEAFARCDNQLYSMLRRWARFRHPNKSAKWIARKYWAQRLKDHPMFGTRTGLLLKDQHGRCPCCGLHFKPGDVMEIDHKFPRHLGGEDRILNLQLLHRHCHDRKTATLDAQLVQEVAAVPMTGAV